jgi:hypothetical protein
MTSNNNNAANDHYFWTALEQWLEPNLSGSQDYCRVSMELI